MGKRKATPIWLCSTILFLSSGVDIRAIRSVPQSTVQKQVPIKVREETVTKLEEAVKKVDGQISENCLSLENTIVTANAETEMLGYHEIQYREDFQQRCTNSGTLNWISTSVIDPDDPDRTIDVTEVTVNATDIQASRALPNGMVELSTNPASIDVYYGGQSFKRIKCDIDLRKPKHAISFVSVLKDLAANIKKRQELRTNLDEAQAELEAVREKSKSVSKKPKRGPARRKR